MTALTQFCAGKAGRWALWVVCLLTLGLHGPKTWAAAREKLDVVVLLDNSGSMLKDAGRPGNDVHFTRLAAVQYLVQKMAPGDRIALVTFDSVVHTDSDASRLQDVAAPGMPQSFYAGVQRIAANPNASTDMADGLRQAAALFGSAAPPGKRRRFLIFLTDGTPNPEHGENTPERLTAYAATLKQQGIALHTVGLGALSADPAEADAARRLLVQMAVQGGGAPHLARTADDLPALFGSIFAQLVGHEVSRPVADGATAQFTIAPGTHNLRVIATSDGAAPELQLTDPSGKPYQAMPVPPLLPGGQTALLAAASVNDPPPGTWTVRAVRGALEAAWEPNFEAVLRTPGPETPVPSDAPFHIVVDVRQRGSTAPASLPGGRVQAEYQAGIDAVPTVVTLAVDPSGAYEGDLPDSGPAGPHDLVVRCFRQGDSGEEEGGPARATLTVADLPALTLQAPGAGAFETLGLPIPVAAQVRVAGRPAPPAAESGLEMRAQINDGTNWPNSVNSPLQPDADGGFTGSVVPVAPAGPATLSCILSGRYNGQTIAPQTVTVPLMVTPRPVVEIAWPSDSILTPGRHGTAALDPQVRASAGAATSLQFSLDGPARAVLSPAALPIASGQPRHAAALRVQCRGVPPGRYPITITARAAAPGVDVTNAVWRGTLYVPTWLEQNRWWLYPTLGLSALLILAIVVGAALWAREQTRRRRQMLDLLNGAKVYIPYTSQPFQPPPQTALLRRSYTFGGPGADVFLPDPKRPGEPLFAEPRLRVGVVWRSGGPRLEVTPEGALTQWLNTDGRLLSPPLTPTQGGDPFRIMPENVLVSVSSEWAY